jgi:hypothetical protein
MNDEPFCHPSLALIQILTVVAKLLVLCYDQCTFETYHLLKSKQIYPWAVLCVTAMGTAQDYTLLRGGGV